MNIRIFGYQDDKSSKFWEVTQSDATVVVRYGKTGAVGLTQEKVFPEAGLATQHVQKLISEKIGKGYLEILTGSTANEVNANQTMEEGDAAPNNGHTNKKMAVKAIKTAKAKNPLQDPETTLEQLVALLDKDDATNRLLAKHPRASEELLEKLSHSSDKATRQAVTANPNIPPKVYVRLGQQFPKEFLANPALDLLLLMNPALMEEVPEALLVRLLKQESCPTSLLSWASASSSKQVQLAVTMNPRAPASAINKLKESRYADVARGLQNNRKEVGLVESESIFQQEICNRLGSISISEATDAWKKKDIGLPQFHLLPILVQHSIAGADVLTVISDGNIPVEILEILSKSEDIEILAAVAKNPNTSRSALELIGNSAKDWQTVFPITENPKTPSQTLLNLAKKSSNVKGRIASNPSLSLDEHESFSTDPDNDVRCAYAQNILLSSTRLEVLSKSKADSSTKCNTG